MLDSLLDGRMPTLLARALACVIGALPIACDDYSRFHSGFPATVMIELGRDVKLETVVFDSEDNVWLLTRPMRPSDEPEQHSFRIHDSGRRQLIIKEQR